MTAAPLAKEEPVIEDVLVRMEMIVKVQILVLKIVMWTSLVELRVS